MITRAPRAFPGHRRLFTFLPFVLVAALAAGFTDAGLADTQPGGAIDPGAIERFVSDYQTRVGIPGVAIAVTRGKEIVHVAGFGRDSGGQPITPSTLMPIASLSKSFTALAVMQLVEAGKVQLDRPVREYVPDFVLADSRAERITVRQLLAHTSGMADTTFPEKSGPLPDSLAGGVALLRSARLAGDPGARARYHNPNYWVAARIVELVSGEPFSVYLRRQVFEPIGMMNTRTVGSLRQVPELAEGHIRMYGYPLARPEPPWFLDGASGIVTTVADLAQWLIVQNNGGLAVNGTRIISAATIAEMHRGLGWSSSSAGEVPATEHGGWLFTFTAHQMLLTDSGYGIAVLSNVGLGMSPVDSQEIAQALAEMTAAKTPQRPGRTALIVDSMLAALTMLAVAFGVRSVRHAPEWAARRTRRPVWRNILALLRSLLPLAVLLSLPALLGVVFGGRDASWLQVLYLAPSLVISLVAASFVRLAVMVARAVQMRPPGLVTDDGPR